MRGEPRPNRMTVWSLSPGIVLGWRSWHAGSHINRNFEGRQVRVARGPAPQAQMLAIWLGVSAQCS